MIAWLENEVGDFVVDPTNVSRTINYCDLSMLNGVFASESIVILKEILAILTNPPINFKIRLADAKRHAKLVLVKKRSIRDRLLILLESLDVLMGREEFYVPSTSNAIKTIQKLITIFQEHPGAIVRVR